jgi:hypothetical protein
MAAFLSPLSLYGGNWKTKPYYMKVRYTPQRARWNSRRSTIGRMSGNRTPLSLNASLAIPMRVLRFEVSRRARISSLSVESSVLALWLNQGTRRFCGEPPQTLQTQCSLHANPTHDLAATLSRLDLGFEAQPRNSTRLRLVFLATMRPALDPVRPPGPSS